MNSSFVIAMVLGVAALSGCTTSKPEMMGNLGQELHPESYYLPNAEASRVVSVATNGVAAANILVQTHRVAVKETAYLFTFHEEGLYSFVCSLHPNVMFGQILVLPPRAP